MGFNHSSGIIRQRAARFSSAMETGQRSSALIATTQPYILLKQTSSAARRTTEQRRGLKRDEWHGYTSACALHRTRYAWQVGSTAVLRVHHTMPKIQKVCKGKPHRTSRSEVGRTGEFDISDRGKNQPGSYCPCRPCRPSASYHPRL